MGWRQDTKSNTEKVAKKFVESGRKFGTPSADKYAKFLKENEKEFLKGRR